MNAARISVLDTFRAACYIARIDAGDSRAVTGKGTSMRKQLSFSRLWPDHAGRRYATDAEAKAARDMCYRIVRKEGCEARRWVLKNQLKQYESFGVPDGRSCDVFMLDVVEAR